MSKYNSNYGFIIYNNELNCIRCDTVTSFGPKLNSNDNNSKYYINDICVYEKSAYYKEDINKLYKLITDEISNHLKYNINLNLSVDDIVEKYLKLYKTGEQKCLD